MLGPGSTITVAAMSCNLDSPSKLVLQFSSFRAIEARILDQLPRSTFDLESDGGLVLISVPVSMVSIGWSGPRVGVTDG